MNFCRFIFIFQLMMMYVDGAPTNRPRWADWAEEESDKESTNYTSDEETGIPEGEPVIGTPIYGIINETIKETLSQIFENRSTANEVIKRERSPISWPTLTQIMDQSISEAIDDAVRVSLNKRFSKPINEAVKQALSRRLSESKRIIPITRAHAGEINNVVSSEGDILKAINHIVKDALSRRLLKSERVISATGAHGDEIIGTMANKDIMEVINPAVRDALSRRLSKSTHIKSVTRAHDDEITSTLSRENILEAVNQAVKDALSRRSLKSKNIPTPPFKTRELPDIAQKASVSNEADQSYLDKNLLQNILIINETIERTFIRRLSEIGLFPREYFLKAINGHVKRVLNRKFVEAGLITEKKLGIQTLNVQISERSSQQEVGPGKFSSSLTSPSKPYSEALIGTQEGSSAKFFSRLASPSKPYSKALIGTQDASSAKFSSHLASPSKPYSEALTGTSKKVQEDEFVKPERSLADHKQETPDDQTNFDDEKNKGPEEDKNNVSVKTGERTIVSSSEIENVLIEKADEKREKETSISSLSFTEQENVLIKEMEAVNKKKEEETESVEETEYVSAEEKDSLSLKTEDENNVTFTEMKNVPVKRMEEMNEKRREETGVGFLSFTERENITMEVMKEVNEKEEKETENVSAEEEKKGQEAEQGTHVTSTETENVSTEEIGKVNETQEEGTSVGSLSFTEKENIPMEEMEQVNEKKEKETEAVSVEENSPSKKTEETTNITLTEMEVPINKIEKVTERKEEGTSVSSLNFTEENVPIEEMKEMNKKKEEKISVTSLKGGEKEVDEAVEEFKISSGTLEAMTTIEKENIKEQKQEENDPLDKKKTVPDMIETKEEVHRVTLSADLNKNESMNKVGRKEQEEGSFADDRNATKEKFVQPGESSIEIPTDTEVIHHKNVTVEQISSIGNEDEEKSTIRTNKVLVRPKQSGTRTDMFREISELAGNTNHNIIMKYAVIFPSKAVIVTFETVRDADYFRRAVEKSDKIVVKTDESFPYLVWILNLPNIVSKEYINVNIFGTFHQKPVEVEFTESSGTQTAHIEVSKSLFDSIKRHPFIRFLWQDYYIYTSPDARRCTSCWLLGHTKDLCLSQFPISFPMDMYMNRKCIDCIQYNALYYQNVFQLREDFLRDVNHRTNSDDCPTKASLKYLSHLYKMRILDTRMFKRESEPGEGTSTSRGKSDEETSEDNIVETFIERHSDFGGFTSSGIGIPSTNNEGSPTSLQTFQNKPTNEEKQILPSANDEGITTSIQASQTTNEEKQILPPTSDEEITTSIQASQNTPKNEEKHISPPKNDEGSTGSLHVPYNTPTNEERQTKGTQEVHKAASQYDKTY